MVQNNDVNKTKWVEHDKWLLRRAYTVHVTFVSSWDVLEWLLLLWRVGCYEASQELKNVTITRRVAFSRRLTGCYIFQYKPLLLLDFGHISWDREQCFWQRKKMIYLQTCIIIHTDHCTEVLEKHTKYFSWTVSSLKYLDIRFLLSVIC